MVDVEQKLQEAAQQAQAKKAEEAKKEVEAPKAEAPAPKEEPKADAPKPAAEKSSEAAPTAKPEKTEKKIEEKAKPDEKAAEQKKEDAAAEELEATPREIVEEKLFTIPLIKAYKKPENKRGPYAVRMVKAFLSRHMKVNSSAAFVSPAVNNAILSRGFRRPPKKIKIKASRDKEGKVFAEPVA